MSRIDTATQRLYVPITSILEGERIRTDYGDLKSLAASIDTEGLIHPITIDLSGRLIAGGRRFRAHRDVLKRTEIAVTYIEVADDATMRRLEAEENVRRKDMTWQERVMSVRTVHNHQVLQAIKSNERWTLDMTGALIGQSQGSVSYVLMVASLLDKKDKEALECASFTDAVRLIVKRKEDEVNAILARSTLPQVKTTAVSHDITDLLSQANTGGGFFATAPVGLASRPTAPEAPRDLVLDEVVVPLSSMLHKAEALGWLASHPACCDHIICDPPYGIDMDMIQQDGGGMNIDSTRAEHDVADNQMLLASFFTHAYTALRDKGFLIAWCDYSNWDLVTSECEGAGFTIQRWPLIWSKTHNCQNMAAQYNFTKNHEIALVARKGNATLINPQASSIWQGTFDQGEKESLGHPFAKPGKLWQWIYSAVAQRGQTVLDPFAGRGSSTLAAIRSGLKPISVELTDHHYNGAVVNVTNLYKSLHPKVRFE